VLDAGTQGMIGYLIQQELRNLAAGGAVPAAPADHGDRADQLAA